MFVSCLDLVKNLVVKTLASILLSRYVAKGQRGQPQVNHNIHSFHGSQAFVDGVVRNDMTKAARLWEKQYHDYFSQH